MSDSLFDKIIKILCLFTYSSVLTLPIQAQSEYFHFSNESGVKNALLKTQARVSSADYQGDVLIYGDYLTNSLEFQQSIKDLGFNVKLIGNESYNLISTTSGKTLVLSGEKTLHPAVRKSTDLFLRNGGNVLLVGAKAFDYSPIPQGSVSVVDFSNANSYSIVDQPRKVASASVETPTIRVGKDPSGHDALEIFTSERGMSNYMARIPVSSKRTANRSVITFSAKGNSYVDLLALEIVDSNNARWYAFVPVTNNWQDYSVSMADFIPENWKDSQGEYPLLDPQKVETLFIGVNLMTIWREKPMYFGLSNVALAENQQTYYTPTSALNTLRLPFFENDIFIPEWTLNPMNQAVELTGNQLLFRKETYPFGPLQIESNANIAVVPKSISNHPGSLMGTDTESAYDFRSSREKRIVSILETGDMYPAQQVARIELPTGGRYSGSTLTLFGVTPAEMVSKESLTKSLLDALTFVNAKALIVNVEINTTISTTVNNPAFPKLKVTFKNPLNKFSNGKVTVNIADGKIIKEQTVLLPPNKVYSMEIILPEVPADFPMKEFKWSLSLNANNNTDIFEDQVDVERSMLIAFRHLIRAQNKYPDGRISNHYFGDAYGIRAMFAYLDYVKSHPESMQKNQNIWKTITLNDISNCAHRFYDMLVNRQLANGALPMGYSEHTFGYNLADGGQMALSVAQSLRYIENEITKNKYQNLVYKFGDWSETFYIDSIKSALIKKNYPVEYSEGQGTIGHYGLAQRGTRQIPYGPSWVGSCILPSQIYLAYWNKTDDENKQRIYEYIANRNIEFYVNKMTSLGYYQVEALFWSYLSVKDELTKNKIINLLDNIFIPERLKGEANDMFGLGGRNTLYALSMIYYQRFIKENSNLRAALLKYVWTFGSESSSNGIGRLTEAFPKPIHGESLAATKYATLSSLWSMELLSPASTLFGGLLTSTEAPQADNNKNKIEGLKVYSSNSNLHIETSPSQHFSLYDINGRLLSKHFDKGVYPIANGIYLVQLNNKIQKVVHY